ncbi:MAG: hypothetical protein QME21_14290 [Anaerolineales bacterium]|nr:hypothetical protein [Anaerolineales bacterium]
MRGAQKQTLRVLRGFLYLLLPLILAAMACQFPGIGGNTSLQQTNVALGIQQTMNAINDATLQAQLTQVVAANPTVPQQNVQATLDAQATAIALDFTRTAAPAATDTLTQTNSPTPTIEVALDEIPIVEWKMFFWVTLNSGCYVDGAGCWRMNDDYRKNANREDVTLVSKNPVRIDPAWPRPYLVFWHKYDFEKSARIDLLVNNNWITIKNFRENEATSRWIQEAFSLESYKGKEISVRFLATSYPLASQWYVNDVRIVPNYTP